MAQQIPPYANNRGTLTPGQTISVNKYTVQVERYLSQGGFAHVYLVRTAAPVYNTTHHVLKRIAVADDAILTEVKKEVDIMRILKGHPNIVHLIDAAWHRLSNGTYEVFILMEFCPGGGIIDMMNRRLRERLTEAEILTVFVDVCEGVAAMHNLRPSLLHRDLKVENILQASATSYKLCDFGSATTVTPRPPSTTQEIRALEADLNRHTTLQYRAPEMVDPHLRRPIDEKSDVWALGVLLYKLCYYTTPFEEHGQLAILNVQYKIPPYPVYSPQMNSLIASMLREHGTQRPSIFELLEVVHQIRGTKSRFNYTIPERHPLSPRPRSTNNSRSALDDLVTIRSQKPAVSPLNNAGTQARDKVLEAIAPMRRGRPMRGGTSRSPSPKKDKSKDKWLDGEFNSTFSANEGQPWKAASNNSGGIKGHKSGVVSSEAWKGKAPMSSNDGWQIRGTSTSTPAWESNLSVQGFGDSFDVPAFAPSASPSNASKSGSDPIHISSRSTEETKGVALSPNLGRLGAPRGLKSKDAFDGLGFSEKPPAPTLGEARKVRTGLAIPMEKSFTPRRLSPQPPPSPRRSPHTLPSMMQPQSQNLTIEERFPSVEELDRRIFGSRDPSPLPSPKTEFSPWKAHLDAVGSDNRVVPTTLPSHVIRGITGGLRSTADPGSSVNMGSGSKSQNVTETVMQEPKKTTSKRQDEPSSSFALMEDSNTASQRPSGLRSSRPSLSRKHRSYIIVKKSSSQLDVVSNTSAPAVQSSRPPVVSSSSSQGRDWLTGDDDEHIVDVLSRVNTNIATAPEGEGSVHGTPVLRESPSKRASFFEKSPHLIPEPLEGDVEQGDSLPPPVLPLRPSSSVTRPTVSSSATGGRRPPVLLDTGSPSKGTGLSDNWSPVTMEIPISSSNNRGKSLLASDSEDEDEGPEDPDGYKSLRGRNRNPGDRQGKRVTAVEKSKRRQSSVHDLVDLWGGSSILDKERGGKRDTNFREEKRNSAIPPSSTVVSTRSPIGPPESFSGKQIVVPSQVSPEKPLVRSPPKEPSKHPKELLVTDAKIASSLPSFIKPISSTSSGPLPTSRSRPQSMFVFPSSKSTIDSTGLPLSGLNVPAEGIRTISATRRTSISNMVQHYEVLGSGLKVPSTPSGLPPLVSVKPTALKLLTSDNHTGLGSSNTKYTNTPANSPGQPSEDMYSGAGPQRPSPVRSPDKSVQRLSLVEYDKKDSTTAETTDSGLGSTTTKVVGRDDSTTNGEPLSPSPERPYPGVSRLIDQWQKKAEESNVRDARRGGGIAKRYGTVHGSAR